MAWFEDDDTDSFDRTLSQRRPSDTGSFGDKRSYLITQIYSLSSQLCLDSFSRPQIIMFFQIRGGET